jgi:CheY-like chemotaxis protein
MVVEDEYFIRVMIADELRGCGFQVIECQNADEAMDVLNAGAAVSIIFTDIRMPGSMDGITFARVVKREFPNLPVLLTSAQSASGLSAAPFVQKPYQLAHVIQLIDELLTGTPRPPNR